MNNVFISYSHWDSKRLKYLCRLFEDDGISYFLAETSIAGGELWLLALERAIEDCQCVLLALSPKYFDSLWTSIELRSSLSREPFGADRTAIPVIIEQCDSHPSYPEIFNYISSDSLIDLSSPESTKKNYATLRHRITTITENALVKSCPEKMPPVRRLPRQRIMPFLPLRDRFVGRKKECWNIFYTLQQKKAQDRPAAVIISGPPGIGKTQLAIEYVHRFGCLYSGGIFWKHADKEISSFIAGLSEVLGVTLNPRLTLAKQLRMLWKNISPNHLTLIILDNHYDVKILSSWFSLKRNIHLIITTRQRHTFTYPSVSLGYLSAQESIDILNADYSHSIIDCRHLAKLLGGIPLALEIVRNILNKENTGIRSVIEKLKTSGTTKVLEAFVQSYVDDLPSGCDKEIAKSFLLSWESLTGGAKSVLRVLSLCSQSSVPKRLLTSTMLELDRRTSCKSVDNGLMEAYSKSLIDFDCDSNPVLHQLIADFVQCTFNERHKRRVFSCLRRSVFREMARAGHESDSTTYSELEEVTPHAIHLVESSMIASSDAIDILNYIGRHYQNIGQYRNAEKFLRYSHRYTKKFFGNNASKMALATSNLGLLLRDLGKFRTARDMLEQTLELKLQVHSPNDTSVAFTMSNLGVVLSDMGEYSQAAKFLTEALEIERQHFADCDPNITIDEANLAVSYQALGKLIEAEKLLEKVLECDYRNYPPDHPALASTKSILGTVMMELGELDKAYNLHIEALRSLKKHFHKGHIAIAREQSNLAVTCTEKAQIDHDDSLLIQACENLEEAINVLSIEMPTCHPRLLKIHFNRAVALVQLGDYPTARKILNKATKCIRRLHPVSTVEHIQLLAIAAQVSASLGNNKLAKKLVQETTHLTSQISDIYNSNTAIMYYHLALAYRSLNEISLACQYLHLANTSFAAAIGDSAPRALRIQSLIKELCHDR